VRKTDDLPTQTLKICMEFKWNLYISRKPVPEFEPGTGGFKKYMPDIR
jgi:hypothetical protein